MRKIFILLVAGTCMVAAGSASAELQLCNKSSSDWIRVAVASGQQGAMYTSGWWMLGKGECQFVISEPLSADSSFYYYAHSLTARSTWGGEHYFCTKDGMFQLSNAETCSGKGKWLRGFRKVETNGKPSISKNLTSKDEVIEP